MKLEIILEKINFALDELYAEAIFLFQKDLCERCINHRFAIHLETQGFPGYHIDCEYNKSHAGGQTHLKKVSNSNGNYIDVIITKRDGNADDNLACFEIKKWNNYKGRVKDRENLKILTDQVHFAHKFGFYIIYGETRAKTKIEIYETGQLKK